MTLDSPLADTPRSLQAARPIIPPGERIREPAYRDAPTRDPFAAAVAAAHAEGELATARVLEEVQTAAEEAAGRSISVPDAHELATPHGWLQAAPERRAALARQVAASSGEDLVVDARGLLHAPTGARFVLVPGGTFSMGLSPEEEAVLRQVAEQRAGTGDWERELGSLDSMRPVREVTVAPFLIGRHPSGGVRHVARAIGLLASTPFRLPSEAEWEYAARGGRARELTPLGNAVASAPDDFVNGFGLDRPGHLPELCSDAMVHGYDDAPTDGTPRHGPGARVVRGGAAWTYPWHMSGGWRLLCSAFRGDSAMWAHQAAVRLAIGVTLA